MTKFCVDCKWRLVMHYQISASVRTRSVTEWPTREDALTSLRRHVARGLYGNFRKGRAVILPPRAD